MNCYHPWSGCSCPDCAFSTLGYILSPLLFDRFGSIVVVVGDTVIRIGSCVCNLWTGSFILGWIRTYVRCFLTSLEVLVFVAPVKLVDVTQVRMGFVFVLR